jgi:hypothetical protein
MRRLAVLLAASIACLTASCGGAAPPSPPPRPAPSAPPPRPSPCFEVRSDPELRAKDASKLLEETVKRIRLGPEDEALRHPKSLADVDAILRRDVVYLFAEAAAFARSLETTDGRVREATLELLLGESQLIAAQILSSQDSWVGSDVRIARANVASGGAAPATDRERMLGQLVRVVEEGNKLGDALGAVAPAHIARGAAVIRRLEAEAPTTRHLSTLVAEYHRLRGEWPAFDTAMATSEAAEPASPALCYLRGMEQLERFRRPDAGAQKLKDCLAAQPRFVRAKAGLVLMATTPADGLHELAELKLMNEDHYMLMLLEPTLAADQELLRIDGR